MSLDFSFQSVLALPKETWLTAQAAKGLELQGTFQRQGDELQMVLTFTNRAMQALGNFAIQFNKNSFGMTPKAPLNLPQLRQSQSSEVILPLHLQGQFQRMDPINNLQVAIKNNIGVFYFSTLIPLHVLFLKNGEMERRVFLSTWKDIPSTHEKSFALDNLGGVPNMSTDNLIEKLKRNNVFVIAKRNVEMKDMVYLSLLLPRDVWVLMELKVTPGAPCSTYNMAYKCRHVQLLQLVHKSIDDIARN